MVHIPKFKNSYMASPESGDSATQSELGGFHFEEAELSSEYIWLMIFYLDLYVLKFYIKISITSEISMSFYRNVVILPTETSK